MLISSRSLFGDTKKSVWNCGFGNIRGCGRLTELVEVAVGVPCPMFAQLFAAQDATISPKMKPTVMLMRPKWK